MGPTQTHDLIELPSIEHSVDQAGGKSVATPDAIDDPELTRRADGPLPVVPDNGSPLMAVALPG